MVVAMSRDIRVLVIKLADRLHNMRTLRYLPRPKQEQKSREMLEIFAPLAHRLGMNTVKWELEDLAFATLYPKRYDEIARLVSERAPRREMFLQEVIEDVQDDLQGRQDQGPGHRAAEALLLGLPEDDRPQCQLRRHLRPRRHPGPGRLAARLLRGARHRARALESGPRPVQGLHRDAEVQHVPVAAHDGDRPRGQAGRAADPDLGACTSARSTASPRTGSTRRRWSPAAPEPTTWPGCGSWWTGSARPRTRPSSSTRCASTWAAPRCTCSPRAARSSRCRRARRRSTSPTRSTPRWATGRSAPGSTAGWWRWRAR